MNTMTNTQVNRDEIERRIDNLCRGAVGEDGLGVYDLSELTGLTYHIRSEAVEDYVKLVEKNFSNLIDKYEYRGSIPPQHAKEQTMMLVRNILSTLKPKELL